MKHTYEILSISCGQETVNLTTTSKKTAKEAYRRIAGTGGFCRIRVDGEIMTIADSDHWAGKNSKCRELRQGCKTADIKNQNRMKYLRLLERRKNESLQGV